MNTLNGLLGSLFGGVAGFGADAMKAGMEQQKAAANALSGMNRGFGGSLDGMNTSRAKSDAWPKEAANPGVTAVYVGPKLLEAPKDHK